ncbi:uncharacterized protein PITG_02081 [Phytophthora infestans T30-4]|uniref:Uncharacterized protein n=1 Tax=Phytophthora infestans (strain T30-4) TaxID=403677 RepID=D0MVF3_PHYIT|nr:uncharacterized protein PITG_02081 [Phytophthora infestans T30-4]EEY63616.1 conserved hypothetical protein [Phytophthora infestans T30-4]|eukprot:XP_002907052.1 conserved hypothetical protein [Phytophthora infestans T30-4]
MRDQGADVLGVAFVENVRADSRGRGTTGPNLAQIWVLSARVFNLDCIATPEKTTAGEATPGSMRSWPIFAALLANVAISTWFVQVNAAACADICYSTVLTGFGPGGTPGCTCSGSQQGARTGAGGCNCGQCYEKTQGVVYGFAINNSGTCTYGTDCGTCDYSTGSATSTSGSANATPRPATVTPSPAPATAPSPSTVTTAPVPTTSAPSPTAGSSSTSSSTTGSNSTSTSTDNSNSTSKDGVGDATGSHADSEEKERFLSTWQIVLAICCCVLIFVVAVVSVCACYCKARSRLYEHEDDQASYYHQPQTFQPWSANNAVPIATKTNSIVV